ncbi:hypothetical protein [Candidatus Lariskella endosymbiont of Epinotia ramella]|uniref:hypothetical protein n=1 Tax=Candidatus Lariskella endosymbiont of Epinotia ramella TaxID=3066224 RepID=UPI0030CC0F48
MGDFNGSKKFTQSMRKTRLLTELSSRENLIVYVDNNLQANANKTNNLDNLISVGVNTDNRTVQELLVSHQQNYEIVTESQLALVVFKDTESEDKCKKPDVLLEDVLPEDVFETSAAVKFKNDESEDKCNVQQ